VDHPAVGQQLRSLRAASGQTVSMVAREAGLSVPYVANLENGRGNPTLAALSRLATALGARLDVTVILPGTGEARPAAAGPPASLVRLARTRRFRRAVAAMAGPSGVSGTELSPRLVSALAGLSAALGTEPSEADWWRLLDALVLMTVHPEPGE